MSHGDHLVEIEAVASGQCAQMISGRGYVLKGFWPSATFLIGATILDVPGGNSCVAQGIGHGRGVVQVRELHPATAMNHDRNREGTLARRHTQLAKLRRVMAVGDDLIRPRMRDLVDLPRLQRLRVSRGGTEHCRRDQWGKATCEIHWAEGARAPAATRQPQVSAQRELLSALSGAP